MPNQGLPDRGRRLASRTVRLRAFVVSFTVLAVGFCAGRFSLPVFYPVFADQKFGWTHAEAVGGGFFVLLLVGVLGPVIGSAGR